MILAEVARREEEDRHVHQEATKELQVIHKGLMALEREAQRWDHAYAHEVIKLAELQLKKREISERKQHLLTRQDEVEQTARHAQAATARWRIC
jgi:hypothetical protein